MSQKSVCCNNKYLLPHTTHSTCCHMEQLRDFKHIFLAQQGSLNIQLLRSLFPLNPVFTAPQNRTDTTRIPPYLLLIAAAKAKEERTLASAESVVRTLCLLQPCNVLYSHAIQESWSDNPQHLNSPAPLRHSNVVWKVDESINSVGSVHYGFSFVLCSHTIQSAKQNYIPKELERGKSCWWVSILCGSILWVSILCGSILWVSILCGSILWVSILCGSHTLSPLPSLPSLYSIVILTGKHEPLPCSFHQSQIYEQISMYGFISMIGSLLTNFSPPVFRLFLILHHVLPVLLHFSPHLLDLFEWQRGSR